MYNLRTAVQHSAFRNDGTLVGNAFDNEFDSFAAYAKTYPKATLLLVDTYDVLKRNSERNKVRKGDS